MSTWAVAPELNAHVSTINQIFAVHSSPPAQDPHIQVHPQHHLSSAAAAIGLHNQRISSQTVGNRLSRAHLHARRPHRGLDLTAVRCRNRRAHIRWRLALWRGLFMDASRFSGCRPEGRQCHLVEQFGDGATEMNAQRYCGETLRLVVAPFIHDQQPMPLPPPCPCKPKTS